MSNEKKNTPGEGIRSLKTSGIFRVVNFELYTKPNKAIMALGIAAIIGCSGYILYMRNKYEGMGYYAAVDEKGEEYYQRKKSNWD